MEIKMFYLENDRDSARVMFIPYPERGTTQIAVHYPDGMFMTPIKCTGATCEYCKAHDNPFPRYKYFFALYDEDEKCVKFWERAQFGTNLLVSALDNYEDIEHQVFKVTRLGCKGDPATRYVLTPLYKAEAPDIDRDELPTASELFDHRYVTKV